MKKILLVVVSLSLIVGCFYMIRKNLLQNNEINTTTKKTSDTIINSVTFTCSDTKVVQAIFFKDKVELNLSDKRNILLLQAISASGARYANSDESFVFWNKGNTSFIEEKGIRTFKDCIETPKEETKAPVVQLGNPASVNCTKVGGNLVIQKRGDGGEYGLCYFEENRACEEWALVRGDCPLGGRKTTGYQTIDQNYCAWSGGETFAVPNSQCTFKNGKVCSTIDFYNGKCTSTP